MDVRMPDGTLVTGVPDDITQSELLRRFELSKQPQVAPETTIGGHAKEFAKGLGAGAIGLLETAGTGFGALLPEQIEKQGRKAMEEGLAPAKEYLKAERGYEDAMSRKLGEGLGSTIPFAVAGPFGAAGRIASIGVGGAAGAGEARKRAEAEGIMGGERGAATAAGILPGLLDFLPFSAAQKAVGVVSRALIAGGVEGATEAAQEIAQNAIAKGIYKPEQELLEGSGEAAGYGGAVGAMAQALVDSALHIKRRGAKTAPTEEKPQAAGAVPAGVMPSGPTAPGAELQGQLFTEEAAPAAPAPQRFTEQDNARLEELAAKPNLTGEEQQEFAYLMVSKDAAEAAPTEAVPAQEQTVVQPDMVQEAEAKQVEELYAQDAARAAEETKQIEDMYAQEEREPVLPGVDTRADTAALEALVPAKGERQARQEQQKAAAAERQLRTEEQKLADLEAKMAADVAATDARVAQAQELKATPQPTTPEMPAVEAPMQLFRAVKPGYKGGNTIKDGVYMTPNEAEARMFAGEKGTVTPVETTAAALISGATPIAPQITGKTLDSIGIPKAAPIRKRLEGKMQSDPTVQKDLSELSQNPNLPPAIQQNVTSFLATGTVATPVEPIKETPSAVTRPEPTRVGVSPESTVGERGERRAPASSAARTEAPKATGLGTTERVPVQPTKREGKAQPAVKETREEREAKEQKIALDEWSEATNKLLQTSSGPTLAELIAAKKKATKKLVLDATERFKNLMSWFGSSAVTTEDGKPLILYTGTSKDVDFPKFKIPKNGAWFTTDTKDASMYAKDNDSQGMKYENGRYVPINTAARVIPVYLKIEKPYKITKADHDRMNVQNYKRAQGIFFDELRAKGYDGVDFGHGVWVVIGSPTQIKSAVGNLGTFNPSDANFIKLEGPLALVPDVPADVQTQLKNGDLKGALTNLAGKLDGVAGRISSQLANAIGETKVEVVDNLKDEANNPVAGLFDPNTNTIKLDSKAGLSSHTVIHEAVHAATSHVLDNRSHPVTRQLQQLFNDVKDSLDTMYGAQSLDEFVAEAFSNPEFQAKLESISPKGAPLNGWQRFTNTIKNFIRRMVGMEATSPTAMGEADTLITAILSPSPETRDAGSLYMMSALGKGGEWIDNVIKGRSFLPNGPNVDAFHEFFTGTVPKAAKKALLGALPGHAFSDVAESRIPMADIWKRTIELQSAEEHKALESLNESVKDVNRWYRKQTRDVRNTFDMLGPDSSRLQVDPSKPRSEYANKKDKDGNDLGKAWDSLQADWKKIGPEGQALYKMMRDTYAKQRDKIQELLGARIDETVDNPETATQLKNEIYKRLAKRGGIDPYFPLHREGDYWLSFMGKDPRFGNDEPIVRAFTSKRARDRFIAEHKDEIKDVKEYGNFRASNFKGLPPTAFTSNIIKTLENAKVDAETIDQVMRLYIDLLPESSFAQAFRTRKGTLGYEGSAVDTFRKKTYSIERQLSSMKYGAKYAKIIADTEEHVKATGSDPATVLMADELIARAKLAASPQVPKWAKVATSLNFNMFMGLNLSSALVNMTQIPLVVAPYLGGKYGLKETTQAIGRATKIIMNSGKDRQIDDYLSTPDKPIKRTVKSYLSIDNYDFSKQPELKHLETLARIADERGQLNHSQMQDALDMDSTDTVLGRANAVTGFVFHHGERINRQVAMVAAYELELQKLVGKGKPLSSATQEQMNAAAQEAIFNTEITNGDTSAAAAPRLAQGPSGIGKVMFLFKRYGASMYYMLFKTARQALSSTDPETRKAAMKQLAGIYGSSALLAGVRGVPLFGLMAWMFDMFRDDDEDNAAALAQKWMGETAYKGALNALTGFEISGRVGLSDLIFRDNPYSKDLTPTQALFQTLGGPLLSIADKSFRGFQQIGEGNVERGIEQIAPSAIGNVMKSIRYATEGTTTLRGDPITGEVGAWNVAGQFFGFAPAEYIQQQEINANIKRIDKATNQQRTKLLKKYYVALREGDADGMRELMSDMADFTQKHPSAAITGKTIRNSMAQHMKTSATMYHGITLSKNMRNELLRNAAEYDNGIDLFD